MGLVIEETVAEYGENFSKKRQPCLQGGIRGGTEVPDYYRKGSTAMTEPSKQEVTEFLDALYSDGWGEDMHDAGPCLEIRFNIGRHAANRFLNNWIDDFKKENSNA